ncbi:MAG: CotH kinase family protein [Caldilineaceae bacterium]
MQRVLWLRVLLLLIVIFSLGDFHNLHAFNAADIDNRSLEKVSETGLFINELMSDNGSTLADEDGEYADWIELHNAGDAAVSLTGYGLSDKVDDPFAWVFPAVEIQPGGFLLVWASGKERVQPDQPLHTNFKISAGGEPLVLSHTSGAVIDQIDPVSLRTDVSYGRSPDGAADLRFFLEATPGVSNTTPGYTEFLPPPDFSITGGFYTQPVSLTLTSSTADVTILYTVDGSDPDPQNLDGRTYTYTQNYPQNAADPVGDVLTGTFQTKIYTGPLSIADRSNEANMLAALSTTWHSSPEGHIPDQPVYMGTVVRARSVRESALASPIVTHTYFVSPDALNRYALPVVSLAVQADRLFDYDIGVYTAGVDFDTWRAANPNAVVDNAAPANYTRRGDTWEYPTHFEYFLGGGERAVAQNLGFRLHGEWSRAFPQKSLRFYASDDYDTRNELDYAFFPDLTDRVTGEPITQFRRLLLRNAGNDNLYTRLRDPFVQALVKPLGLETQAYQPVVLFINGEYWGLINLRERTDRYDIAAHYNLDPDDIALLEENAAIQEGDETDRNDYLALRDYIATHDMADPVHFAYAAERMDMDNFILYYVTEIYAANVDWPHNNIAYWRTRTPDLSPGAPVWHDGRWRWIVNDMDHAFGLVNSVTHNTLSWAAREDPTLGWSTVIFRQLLANPIFRQRFINSMADQMNTMFLPVNVESVLDPMEAQIQPYLGEHIARWPDTVDTSTASIRSFAQDRPAAMRQFMIDYFGLVGAVEVNVKLFDASHGSVRVNSIDIGQIQTATGAGQTPITWTGIYYSDVPIQVTATAGPGYRFVGWLERPQETSASLALLPGDGVTLTPEFEPVSGTGRVYLPWLSR